MAEIVETVDGEQRVRRVPSASRCLKELKRAFPGANFARVLLTPPGATQPVTCLELRYCAPKTKGQAPIVAVEIDDSDPNTVAMAPIALMRRAFKLYGYEVGITEVVNKGTLDRIWQFSYVPITPEVKEEPKP